MQETQLGSIPGLGRSPAEGNGNLLQYSCLEFHGQRSLEGYNTWGYKELDTTEQLTLSLSTTKAKEGFKLLLHRIVTVI